MLRKYTFLGDEEDMLKFKLICVREGLSMSDVLRQLIHHYIKEHEEEVSK